MCGNVFATKSGHHLHCTPICAKSAARAARKAFMAQPEQRQKKKDRDREYHAAHKKDALRRARERYHTDPVVRQRRKEYDDSRREAKRAYDRQRYRNPEFSAARRQYARVYRARMTPEQQQRHRHLDVTLYHKQALTRRLIRLAAMADVVRDTLERIAK